MTVGPSSDQSRRVLVMAENLGLGRTFGNSPITVRKNIHHEFSYKKTKKENCNVGNCIPPERCNK